MKRLAVDMRVLICMALPYLRAYGGANRANRYIAEELAAAGHHVRVCASSEGHSPHDSDTAHRRFLNVKNVEVCVHASAPSQLFKVVRRELEEFRPERILVSSEDPMYLLLRQAIKYDGAKTYYLAHSPGCLPFGPAAFHASIGAESLFCEIRSIITVSNFCAAYIERWSGLIPVQMYLPIFGTPPFPNFGSHENRWITCVNPCSYKGIDIFAALAEENPDLEFAGVISWGTTSRDVRRLETLANVTLIPAQDDMNVIFGSSRLIVIPSLCLEGFSMLAVEAMLRGIPVIASDIGGLREAKLGTRYTLSVKPISTYLNEWDEKNIWVPVIPPQQVEPWSSAIREVLSSPRTYRRESQNSRLVATQFVSELSIAPLCRLLDLG